MSSTPQFNGEQLATARNERWHQGGDELLTLEAAREWVSEMGLVLFAPRAQQLPTPAPSLVEAVLGRNVSAPTAAETENARGLLARMVAEGTALPLNLLGGPGDVPDFVVSAQAFSYVFTLRGDKGWKQPPSTSGTGTVSPLALKVYEALAAGNALTAGELVTELGREVTENAIARALGELWMQLRVIPLLQQDGAATMWELTTRRFTKQIKAGANAGQPTALSAGISLYLAQALAATEEEVETFLSPLAARSRVRDVLHGLSASRQLEDAVLEGKTLLYIAGELPEFPEVVAAEPAVGVGEIVAAAAVMGAVASTERIRKFDRPRTTRPAREDRGERPARRAGAERGGPRKPFGERKGPAGRERGGFADRERRPVQRDGAERAKPSFTRPWNEDRPSRPRREEGDRPAAAKRPYRKTEEGRGGEKREFRGAPRAAGQDRGARPERPYRPRPEGQREGYAARPARPSGPRREGEGFAPRPSKPFRPRREGEGYASRPSRPSGPRREGEGYASRPSRPSGPRREGEGYASRPSKPSGPRREGEGFASRPSRPSGPRREGEGFASRPSKPFRPRREGEGFAARPSRPSGPRREGEGFAARPSKPFRPRREGEGFSSRPPSGEKRPFRGRDDKAPGRGAGGPGAKRTGKPGFAGKKTFGGPKKFGDKKFGGERKSAGGGKAGFGGKPKPASRARDTKAKDMRSKAKGERAPGPRRETEE